MKKLEKELSVEEMTRLHNSHLIFDRALFELWRGRSCVSSVTAARLTREQADAILFKLREYEIC
jgi:hypothetical protein